MATVMPSDLFLVLFFLSNLWVTVPFRLLALLSVWRFHLNIQPFLDYMARDLTGESGLSRQDVFDLNHSPEPLKPLCYVWRFSG